MLRVLFVPQRVDGILACGLARWVDAEGDAGNAGDREAEDDRRNGEGEGPAYG